MVKSPSPALPEGERDYIKLITFIFLLSFFIWENVNDCFSYTTLPPPSGRLGGASYYFLYAIKSPSFTMS
jgi:hypothetical protein